MNMANDEPLDYDDELTQDFFGALSEYMHDTGDYVYHPDDLEQECDQTN